MNYVTPATITGMLYKLEANHYVYRIPDEIDKRIMRVYLTPEGRHLAEKGEVYMISMIERLFDGFSEEELQTLLCLSQKMKRNLQTKE
jgi:DNA-binding MarR family transcriptional regulator